MVFQLGRYRVVKCWELAIINMHAGEQFKLACPAYLSHGGHAYYADGDDAFEVPADTPLTYDLNVLECHASKPHVDAWVKTFHDGIVAKRKAAEPAADKTEAAKDAIPAEMEDKKIAGEQLRAIMDLKSHHHAKSCRNEKTWCDPHLDSANGVAPSKEDVSNETPFWWRVDFPDHDSYKVLRLELKKRGDGNHTDHVIDKVTVEYKNDGAWVWYNNGKALATGQKEEDDKDLIRNVPFDPPFVATEVKIHIKPEDTNMKRIEGRYDLIVAKEPTKAADDDEDKKPEAKAADGEKDKAADADEDKDASPHIKADKKMVK